MAQPQPGWPTDRPRTPPPPTALSNCVVVLSRTQGPINLGMVARLCGNLGVTELRMVGPKCAVDCDESRMFSTHSKDLLLAAPVFASIEEATTDCGLVVGTSGDFRCSALGSYVRAERLPPILAARPVERWALVFGNEADGLNDEELRACQVWIHLDTFGHNPSYNLANAVAITLYVIATASAAAPPAVPEAEAAVLAPRRAVDSLTAYWLATLERFGYFQRTEQERFAPLFRAFIDRLRLNSHDLQVLRGIIAQFNWFVWHDRFDGRGERPPVKDRAGSSAPPPGR
jgi:TrmH family RNA methyltransferase